MQLCADIPTMAAIQRPQVLRIPQHSRTQAPGSSSRPWQQQQQRRQQFAASRSTQSQCSAVAGGQYGSNETVYDLRELLQQCDDLDDDLLEDDEDEQLVWEHERRVKTLPFTEEEVRERELFLARQQQQRQELQQQAAAGLLPDPMQAVSDVVSAYTAAQGFRQMSVQELAVALTGTAAGSSPLDLVLDVRSHTEFAAGPTIPTAVNLPLDLLSDAVRAGQLDPYHKASIAVVCASGQRSAQATVRLSKVFGFRDVVNVSGGMHAWQQMQGGGGGGGGGGGCGCGSGGSGGGGGCSK